jgi:beta-phosphoglucomutase-like phosphatase (HAD superfamily)
MDKSIDAVIFDFNGTLFNDSQFHNQAWSRFAFLYEKVLKPDDFDNNIHGFTNTEIFKFLFQRTLGENEIRKFYEEKENIYRNICKKNTEKCVMTPGAEEYLDYLLENNFPRTIATASYLPNIDMYFEMFLLQRWFSPENIIYDSGEYRGKPYPDLFIAAAERIKIPINKCMVVEDSISGVQAAKNAGAGRIIAVDFNDNMDKFSRFDFIDSVITDFRQLIPAD